MTTLTDIRRIFSVRGIDPDHLSQPASTDPDGVSFLFAAPTTGAQVWFAPDEQDGQRVGWVYSAWNRHGEVTEAGHIDTTAPEGLVAVLHRHQKPATMPASPRQRDTLLALGNPAEHTPLALQADSPADRWILGLFAAWIQLEEADGNINGGDLVDHLSQAFTAIGLTEQLGLDELADRVDPGPRPEATDPAAPTIAAHLEHALGQALDRARGSAGDPQPGVLTLQALATDMAAELRRAGLLTAAAQRPGQVGA